MLKYIWNINTPAKLALFSSSIVLAMVVAALLLIQTTRNGDKLLERERLYSKIQSILVVSLHVSPSDQQAVTELATSETPQMEPSILALI
jgi:hypothetical protein